jgi:hypothetical protein
MEDINPLVALLAQQDLPEYCLFGTTSYLVDDHLGEADEDENDANKMGGEGRRCLGVTKSWRLKMAEWSFEVLDHFSFNREVAAMALNYVDRYMLSYIERCGSPLIGKNEFQLMTLVALFVAIKLHGESLSFDRMNTSTKTFSELSQNRFSTDDIEAMELKLLGSLRWKLNPPLPVTFVHYLLELLPHWSSEHDALYFSCQNVRSAIYEAARYLTEISACTAEFAFTFQPCVVGYASILVALDALQQHHFTSNLFPPYQVLVDFFYMVFHQTALLPTSEEVKGAKLMLIDSCPSLFASPKDSPAVFSHVNFMMGFGHNSGGNETSASPTEIISAFKEENFCPSLLASPRDSPAVFSHVNFLMGFGHNSVGNETSASPTEIISAFDEERDAHHYSVSNLAEAAKQY